MQLVVPDVTSVAVDVLSKRGGAPKIVGVIRYLLLLSVGIAPLRSSVIIDYLDPGMFSGDSINGSQWLQASWSVSRGYVNVAIRVPLRSGTDGQTFTVTAWLTTGTGPGAPDPIAMTSYTNMTSSPTWLNVRLFSGLSLNPGTYYLTLSSNDVGGPFPGAAWKDWNVPAITDEGATRNPFGVAAAGVFGVMNPTYPPASRFAVLVNNAPLLYTVTGDSVPEPPTLVVVLAASVVMDVASKWRRRGLGRRRGRP